MLRRRTASVFLLLSIFFFLPSPSLAPFADSQPAVGVPGPARTAGSASTLTTQAPTRVTVVSPNGLQRWEAGASRKILFETSSVSNVRIEVSDDAGGSWSDIVASTPASPAEYTWTVPASIGDQYLVRVTDAAGTRFDVSDQTFSVVPEVTGDYFDYVFFSDSPTPLYYEPSWSTVTAPSTLVQYGSSMPVTADWSLVGNYSISLEWNSQTGGDWGAGVASIGWVSHDATQADSLVFNVYTDQFTAQADLPCIYLEDLYNLASAKIPLSTLTGAVPGGAWHRVALPVQVFLDNPGSADMTRVKGIFLGQENADGVVHHWFLDDIRMTGVHVVTGDDGPLLAVLGSSTAAGTGASSPDSSWVGRFSNYVHGINPDAVVLNLAVGGYTTYHIRETGYTPPGGRPAPSPEHNITHALAYKPWGIIVNLPSNDVAAGYALEEQLQNYDAVKALADAADVPIWFSTAQPRNFATQEQRDVLFAQTDSTFARFGTFAIDFWNGVGAPDGTILPQYDSGDGTHLNDSGHALLFSRVLDADVWSRAVTAVGPGEDHGSVVPPLPLLYQNAPNPFAPRTRIHFELPNAGEVTLDVFDVRGRLVRRLLGSYLPAREHDVIWDGRDDRGQRVSSGAYLCRLTTIDGQRSRIMVLMH
jgi:lysophospholipase L1-like esterase